MTLFFQTGGEAVALKLKKFVRSVIAKESEDGREKRDNTDSGRRKKHKGS